MDLCDACYQARLQQMMDPLRYLDPEDQTFNCVIPDISVVLREITILDNIEASSNLK